MIDYGSFSIMMILVLEFLVLEVFNISFVYFFFGFVKGLFINSSFKIGGVICVVFKVVGVFFFFEVGERYLFLVISVWFLVRDGGYLRILIVGVGFGKGVLVVRGIDVRDGSGVYFVNFDGELVVFKV